MPARRLVRHGEGVAAMTSLSTFPLPLLRLVLLGGGGLAPAWGPLLDKGGKVWAWLPDTQQAVLTAHTVHTTSPLRPSLSVLSLPLDASSPWPARLAMVAAWVVEMPAGFAVIGTDRIEGVGPFLRLTVWEGGTGHFPLYSVQWSCLGGAGHGRRNLPTLPAYLANHPPEIALPLALFDVPEIRARVEAVCPA